MTFTLPTIQYQTSLTSVQHIKEQLMLFGITFCSQNKIMETKGNTKPIIMKPLTNYDHNGW
jgi:hypothetical protein